MANEHDQNLEEEDLLLEKMKETRTSITEKLEQLEHKVVDSTVKAVGGSVGSVLDTTQAVKDTVESVKESVQQTVDSVKEFAQQGVESLKETLDLRKHTQRHPWLVMGGAVAVGYCLEKWLFSHAPEGRKTALPPPSAGQPVAPVKGHGTHRNGGYREKRESPSHTKSWLAGLFTKFAPEMDQVKRMALGVTLSLLRDAVARAVPPDWTPKVTDTFNRLAEKMKVEITEFSEPQPATATGYAAHPEAGPTAEPARTSQWPERNLGRFDRQ